MSRPGARLALLVAPIFLLPCRAWCDAMLGGDRTTGAGYRGFDVKGSLDLDAKGDWEADATYAGAHSFTGTESRSQQLNALIYHDLDDRWSSRFGAVGWRDTLNAVQYLGPVFGFTYAAKDER